MSNFLTAVCEIADCGYRWWDDGGKAVPWLIPDVPVHHVKRYNPMIQEHGALFRTFADTPATADGVLAFANRNGILGAGKSIAVPYAGAPEGASVHGETLYTWEQEIKAMREAVARWDALEEGNAEALHRLASVTAAPSHAGAWFFRDNEGNSFEHQVVFDARSAQEELARYISEGDFVRLARFYLQHVINARLVAHTAPRLLYSTTDDDLGLHIVPHGLLGALWLQFANAVNGKKKYRQCDSCGNWFELSPRVSRTSKYFCNTNCRSQHHRDKQVKARRLRDEGRSIDDIARAVESDTETVSGWLAKK